LKHIDEDLALGESQTIADLPKDQIVVAKLLGISWVDMCHEDPAISLDTPSDHKKPYNVEELAIVHLCAQTNGHTMLVDEALLDMVQNHLGFHGALWHKDKEQLFVDCVGC
jgi:hypothetical protein